MIVSKSIKHVVSIGPYETFTVEASVTVDTDKDLDPDASDAEVVDYIDGVLTRAVTPELDEARALPTTVPGSHVHDYSLR